jgi:IS605 OrfB family transposase
LYRFALDYTVNARQRRERNGPLKRLPVNNMERQQRTYQTRLSLTEAQEAIFSGYALLYGKVERSLFAKLRAGGEINHLKRAFQKRFGITARQFNAVHAGLAGKVSCIKEGQPELMEELKRRIKKARQVLKRITKPEVRHQKKRRLAILEQKLQHQQQDRKDGIVRLCFGSRKLFRAQFSLEVNGYSCHEGWRSAWQSVRSSQFFVLGSKDETAGCQGCVVTMAEDGSISLRLRLPNALKEKYTIISGVRFKHGHEAIAASIGRNLSDDKNDRQAISYRFLKDDKGWRVFATVSLPEVKRISDLRFGVIGVDINESHSAVTETDRFGNPIEFFSVSCVTYGKTAEQRRAIIGEAVKEIMAFVIQRKKPLVIEKLDFRKKKSALERQSPKYARMLSSLAYTQIQTIIRARAFDAGIEVMEVNSAYTSVVGQYKFKDRYGMSRHNAAALVIGRRSLGFGESLPSQLHGTLPLPVRNRGRHVWSKWAAVSRKASAAHAAHRRSRILSGSSSSPAFGQGMACDQSAWVGEIPVCQSSLELFE